MRLHYGIAATAVIAVALAVAACDNGPKNPVVSGLCTPGTSSVDCPVTTDSAFFSVTLVSTSCTAKGTTVTVTAPLTQKLTGDGCYESSGKVWNVGSATSGFPAGTQLNFSIISDQTASAPSFRLTGVYPDWSIAFEDGGDSDFNDVVLSIHATKLQ